MSITTKLWGWALLVAGLVLASWAWSPTAYADSGHDPNIGSPNHICGEHYGQLNDNLRSLCPQIDLVNVAPSQPVNTAPTQTECDSNFGGLTPQQQALCALAPWPGDEPAESTIRNLIRSIVSVLAWVAGTAAVIVIIVQGMRMVFSSGDSTAFGNARNGIIYALVGLMIAVLAPHLVRYILSLLG